EDYQVVMQVNATTFVKAGFFERRWLDRLVNRGFVDLVSSDAHNVDSRCFRMHECYDYLKKEYGEEMAQELCHDRAKRILAEQ
ncbi:MAG: capsular biosynthesis protein, partial [Clostridia bacterium]|nr:capsular biosynthesis protein [Clostridia bacterium]